MNTHQVNIMEATYLLSQAIGQLSISAQFPDPLRQTENRARKNISVALALLDAPAPTTGTEGAPV